MGKGTDERIRGFISRVNQRYRVTRAFLFGSRARGDHFNDSDYDVIIVSPDFEGIPFARRIAELYEFWDWFPIDIEPICYTPEEFDKKSKEISTIMRALDEGIEITPS